MMDHLLTGVGWTDLAAVAEEAPEATYEAMKAFFL